MHLVWLEALANLKPHECQQGDADMSEHIHDCTGPDQTCECGWKFQVPRYSVGIEIFDNQAKGMLAIEGFSTGSIDRVIGALRNLADKLEYGH